MVVHMAAQRRLSLVYITNSNQPELHNHTPNTPTPRYVYMTVHVLHYMHLCVQACIYVCGHTSSAVLTKRWEDNLWESVLSFWHVNSRNQTHAPEKGFGSPKTKVMSCHVGAGNQSQSSGTAAGVVFLTSEPSSPAL